MPQPAVSTTLSFRSSVVATDGVVVVDETLSRLGVRRSCSIGGGLIGMAEQRSRNSPHWPARFLGVLPQLAERAPVQLDLAGRGRDQVPRAFVDQQVGTAWGKLVGAGEWTMSNGWRSSWPSHAATAAVAAVDRCYAAAGGAAVYQSSPLQRVFRDIHVASQHAMVAPRVFEPLGRHRFGLPTDLASL